MNILVHAFQISPNRGSEFSVSWNYVQSMSKYHHLYVIVGGTSDTIGDYSDLENCHVPNVDFIFPKPSKMYNITYTIYKKFLWRIGWWTRYIPYSLWNKDVYCQIKNDTSLLSKIDLIHFLSPIGWHEIGYLYRLGKPCIWGPVGAFTNCHKEFYSNYVMKKWWMIALKNISNSFSALMSCNLWRAMKSYDIVIANTSDNKCFIEKHFKTKELLLFPENSMRISDKEIKTEKEILEKYAVEKDKIECIWCGTLEDRKMPAMLLDIIKCMKQKNKIHVTVIGGGYMEDYLRNRIESEDMIDCITLIGKITRDKVRHYFVNSQLHLLTSSYEGLPTVMWEAMEECVPSIVFDQFGMADLVKDGFTGKKIVVRDYETMCKDFAIVLDELITNPEKIKSWSMNLREDSKKYTKEKRAEFFENCYELAKNIHFETKNA